MRLELLSINIRCDCDYVIVIRPYTSNFIDIKHRCPSCGQNHELLINDSHTKYELIKVDENDNKEEKET